MNFGLHSELATFSLKDLPIGTRIYYGGDMANHEELGTVIRTWVDRWGENLEARFDPNDEYPEGRVTTLNPCLFSREYLGHGGTRFVTEKAYNEYKAKQREQFEKQYRLSINKAGEGCQK